MKSQVNITGVIDHKEYTGNKGIRKTWTVDNAINGQWTVDDCIIDHHRLMGHE
jgi:hypothetical protein